ncbi:hypothetical protein MAL1_00181 [Bacteriophage DSS3_MAL1]|nr:hypothetical protein MAL1_00181 [Bacteriophage DSS3_MAL1]
MLRPAWIIPALRAAYAAAKEVYLDARAAGELNEQYLATTGVSGCYDIEEGRKYRLSFFRFPHDFIMFWGTPKAALNFDPATPPECR